MAFFIWSNLLEADILKIKLIHHDHSQRFSNPKIRRNVCVFLICWLYSFCSPNVHAEPGSNAKHDTSVPFLSFVSGKGSKQGRRASMHMAWHLVLQCCDKEERRRIKMQGTGVRELGRDGRSRTASICFFAARGPGTSPQSDRTICKDRKCLFSVFICSSSY